MGDIGGMFGIGGGGGDDAADASIEAAEIQAASQREALDYLREQEAVPQQFREGALTTLGGLYGLPGGQGSIAQLEASPIYQAMADPSVGQEAIMRNRSLGGLRGGGSIADVANYTQNLRNQALLQSVGGLQSLAGTPSYAPQIAGLTSGIGQTQAQGLVAAEQARQQGQQQSAGNLMGLANLGLQAYGAFSDRRLKKNIKHIGYENGHKIYTWDWNEDAEKLGKIGPGKGVIADEVEQRFPSAVSVSNGYKTVNYEMIGVSHG